MKYIGALLVLLFLLVKGSAQPSVGHHGLDNPAGDASYAPVLVFTNGGGVILLSSPFSHGGMFQAGQSGEALAVADPWYVFTGWNPVTVYTVTTYETVYGPDGELTIPVVSTDFSPISVYYSSPMLKFTVEPERVLFSTVTTNEYMVVTNTILTSDVAWQANFVKLSGRWHR